jgi:two-component system chemotaxis response regulator CheB
VIKVLVVDDSMVAREFITHILNSDPAIHVVGVAKDGDEALEAVKQQSPDVITMDIRMPRMNGLEATRIIMEKQPTPIVIVSGSLGAEEAASFRAIEAGALAVLSRPAGIGHTDHDATAKQLIQTVKLMSEVKVVRRWPRARQGEIVRQISSPTEVSFKRLKSKMKLVAIGASTGGPVVLQQILSGLPKDFSVPVLIVQHIAAGFVQGFAQWLAQSSGFPVQVATHGEQLLPGRAFVASDGFHMEVQAGHIILRDGEPENNLRPSVSALFRSVAQVFGPEAVGVLLTGMGRDGADELKLLKEMGALTIAQDEKSSVIHGMPGEAIRLGAAMHVLPPERIASMLVSLASPQSEDVEHS